MLPGQATFLRTKIEELDWFEVQFDKDTLWDGLMKMTDEQRRYAHFLINHKKSLKLRELLLQLGVKPKTYEN